jgi:cytochrome c oxidase subunit 3
LHSNSQVAAATHDPALRHHFVDMDQQKSAASFGMWLFLATEIMFFGGMFCAYLIYRYWYFGEFAAGSETLSIKLGAFNTAVLIASSLTVCMGVWAAQTGRRKQLTVYLLLTIVLGVVFLGVKGVEYKEKFEKHHVPGSSFQFQGDVPGHPGQAVDPQHAQIFFSLYFAMTGMHAIHMIIGIVMFGILAFYSWKGHYTPGYYTPIENAGLYWHFVDIVWIYLFPLLYLIDRHP